MVLGLPIWIVGPPALLMSLPAFIWLPTNIVMCFGALSIFH